MSQEIKTINLGGVNCFLIKNGDHYMLVDTGFINKRSVLEKELESAGCKPGNLKLIILTHGDSDHADNAATLREKYGSRIAMHSADWGMVERGDMSWNRKARPDKISIIFRFISLISSAFVKAGNFNRFTPDLAVDEGFDLSEYGFDGRVLHIPGHSKGSIGILTGSGDLICGDLLYNMPGFFFADDLNDFNASVEKLKNLPINTIFPGHGKPFPMKQFLAKYR